MMKVGADLIIEACPGLGFHQVAQVRPPEYGNGPEFNEGRANARLIAAAPDLLAALMALLERAQSELADPLDVPEIADAHAAITKATGEA